MKIKLLSILLAGSALCSVASGADPAARNVLPAAGFSLLPPVTERAFYQETLKRHKVLEQAIKLGDEELKKNMALPPEQSYMEYFNNGNRANHEKAYGRFCSSINQLAMAAALTGDEKYVKKLEPMLIALCRYPSWLLPAHDVGRRNWEGKGVTIDLVSSRIGWELSLIRQVLAPMLKSETTAMIDRELEKRIFAPFERMLDGKQNPHWLRSKNNWSIVCLTNVNGAVIGGRMTPERRLKLLDGVIRNSNCFLEGFGSDGYCSEGMSYWKYGFGNYLMLALTMHKASGGKLNLMARPQARLAANYPERIRISDTIFPAFSDCSLDEKLPATWLGVRDYLTSKPSGYWRDLRLYSRSPLIDLAVMGNIPKPEAKTLATGSPLPIFSEFPNAGIYVVRGVPGSPCRLAAAFKGGSNNEFHNHNDVGSFVLAVDGTVPIVTDPGSEYYDARSFSAKRYESKLNNSFGHCVPRLAGKLQSPGKETHARLVRKNNTADITEVVLDIARAYPECKSLVKIERTFRYDRSGKGRFEVIDHAQFARPETFESAIITFGSWHETAPGKFEIIDRGKKLEVIVDTQNVPFKIRSETIKENIRWTKNPVRIAIIPDAPAKEFNVKLTFKSVE